MENNSINIFYKIFQIMDHYETVLDNYSYQGNKYKPDEKFNDFMNADDFFSFIAKQVPVNKAPKPPPRGGNAPTDEDDDFFSAGAPPPPSAEADPFASEENASDAVPKTDEDAIVKKYIKKCYRLIVLKCHPDKNTDMANSSALFIKCKDYYNEQLLIGLLYIFYLYKIKPPHYERALKVPVLAGMEKSISMANAARSKSISMLKSRTLLPACNSSCKKLMDHV